MRIDGRPELGHLTYCSNIHAGESLAQVMAGLSTHLPAIRAQVAPDQPMGVGLRLGHAAVADLADPERLADLKGFLEQGNFYVFTVNGFPYGPFHGRAVKEGAYKPDWADPLRLAYTKDLARILATLLPEGQAGSLSTVPGTYKSWAVDRLDLMTDHLIQQAADLHRLALASGKVITLALEPEPCCYLETIAEAVEFFEERLFSDRATAHLADLTGLSRGDAGDVLRRHLGICYDVCHAAVEFEDPRASVDLLRARGIRIAKLQLSSAMRIASFNRESIRHLAPFAEPVYLHQVVTSRGGILTRFEDLPQALAAAKAEQGADPTQEGAEWRVHFHVPIFLAQLQNFGTTQSFLLDILALHRSQPISDHLEVETYTWDVLPPRYRDVDLSTAIARELNWVKDRLVSGTRAA